MDKGPAFLVYNASAGSGKTYTLVMEYLKQILLSSKPDYYRSLLAITFTNKAVAEMKQRIINHLTAFANKEILNDPPPLLLQLAEACSMSPLAIHEKSKRILRHLIHNYSGFSVETIDGFNHRLIRTFSKDLKLASNFEVTLDQQQLLDQAVDQLLSKTGEDDNVTKLLVDFTLQKTDDDRSWDISRDIAETSKILFNENDLMHVASLEEKSLLDFITFSEQLRDQIRSLTKEIAKIAGQTMQLIEESGLQQDDFSNGYYPKYLQKLLDGKWDDYTAKWQQELLEKPLYPTRVVQKSPHTASVMDELAPVFAAAFDESKMLVFRLKLLENILKNLTPLSVINLVRREIETIKTEENVIPISEFNSIISAEIRHQPAPFIYERLGERYRHFFVDEFQDTSLLQWDNLIPLIDNALVQEYTDGKTGSLLLVGDAKQSIYRWRGGLPEQFIDIYNCKNPFPAVEKKVENLATNFRSATQIINFNNSFFSYVANYFDDPVHSELYKLGNHQLPTDKQGGYVRIDFVQAENKEELSEVYSEKVINTILELKQQGFNYSDICILTRTKDDGIALGRAMMDQNIAVVSSETLLLQHSPLVSFLLNCLELRPMPDNEEAKAHMLFFLHQHLEIAEASSDFLSGFFPSTTSEFEIRLQQYAINFSLQKLNSLSLYEACEYCIIAFKLAPKADAYLDGFLNLIHEFQQQYSIAMNSFFDYWETKKDIAAISTADNMDAIRLMTIHKAKGLEFPVVLLPYADVRIYREKQAKAWYPGGEITDQFDSFLINYNKEVASYGTIGANLHEERRHKLQLDNMNLLYVALTRAVEQLYIFSQYVSADDADVPQSYNQFFIGFLRSEGLWETSKLRYEFGKNIMVHEHSRLNTVTEIIPEYYCSFPQDHNLYITSGEASLWHSEAERAIETGTVLHELMSKIITKDDLPAILADFRTTNAYSELHLTELQQMISNIVMHPDMLELFSGIDHIENERDIITAEGMLLRPDRLNLHADGTVTITDYKTGEPQATHTDQIKCYGSALEAMGYGIRELLIIYASGEGILINKL